MVKNYSSGVTSIGGTGRTRIYETTPKLKKLFDQYQLNETAIIQQIGHPQYPFVQLKDFRPKKKKGKWLYSKKIIPLFKEMISDTLVVYSDTSFDGKLHIKDSIKIVIHNN